MHQGRITRLHHNTPDRDHLSAIQSSFSKVNINSNFLLVPIICDRCSLVLLKDGSYFLIVFKAKTLAVFSKRIFAIFVSQLQAYSKKGISNGQNMFLLVPINQIKQQIMEILSVTRVKAQYRLGCFQLTSSRFITCLRVGRYLAFLSCY